jgi:hypothetical protein
VGILLISPSGVAGSFDAGAQGKNFSKGRDGLQEKTGGVHQNEKMVVGIWANEF